MASGSPESPARIAKKALPDFLNGRCLEACPIDQQALLGVGDNVLDAGALGSLVDASFRL
jgi:hypothetical protein